MEQQEKNKMKERQIQEKRAKIKAFQGLPPVDHVKSTPLVMRLSTGYRTLKWPDMSCALLVMNI